MIRPVPPEPIRLGDRPSTCLACVSKARRIEGLEQYIDELEEQLRRLTATPELRRNTWKFGDPT